MHCGKKRPPLKQLNSNNYEHNDLNIGNKIIEQKTLFSVHYGSVTQSQLCKKPFSNSYRCCACMQIVSRFSAFIFSITRCWSISLFCVPQQRVFQMLQAPQNGWTCVLFWKLKTTNNIIHSLSLVENQSWQHVFDLVRGTKKLWKALKR